MKKKIPYLLMGILLVAGLAVLLYPAISNWYNAQYQIEAIESYDETVEQMSSRAKEQEIERAKEYNTALTGNGIVDPFIPGGGAELPPNYASILDTHNGVMGVLQIPKIDVNLPIYHGTSQEVLEKGVGHMEMTAFPIGGAGNHSVLTGHTALPTATLFTNLDKMEEGDEFYIQVQKETIAYKVDQIMVVEPSNTKPLAPQAGEDYVTLVTCTPYAINSHRLLVRGTRVPYEEENLSQAGNGNPMNYTFIIVAVAIVVVAGVVVIIIVRKRRRKKRQVQRQTYRKGGEQTRE